MKEFRLLLNCFKNVDDTIESLRTLVRRGEIASDRLKALVCTKKEFCEGLLPSDLGSTIHEFE